MAMEFSSEKFSQKKLSRLVIGSLFRFYDKVEEHCEFFDTAFELGYTTIDTARGYGSEDSIGEWMRRRGNREEVFIITKAGHPSRKRLRITPYDIEADLHDSLAELGTDYIDLFLLHRDNTDLPVSMTVDLMNRFLKEGKIKGYGGSNWTAARIAEANAYAEKQGLVGFAASSPNYSLAEQIAEPWAPGCVTVSGPTEKEQRDFYAKTQMPVYAYSSLARGLFSGRISREMFEKTPEEINDQCRVAYCCDANFTRLERAEELAKKYGASVPQIALAFILCSELNVYPIVGAMNREEMQSNIDALSIKLTEDERKYLDLLD
ncbi:aldo/keto reductase [Ruminococcaceae bacterium OttesenSCG-928-D13]|nr:aldo/keto reductase [Ruminococcaceae bacterium OttesenSCG-928-D13]